MFPSLSSPPLVEGYEHGVASDPVIRSPKEAGYVQTRQRFTRVPKIWHLVYPDTMTYADQTSLSTWESSHGYGATIDTWTSPVSGQGSYSIRLAAPIKYQLGATDQFWKFEVYLEEV